MPSELGLRREINISTWHNDRVNDAPEPVPVSIVQDGLVVGFEAHPDAETIVAEGTPFVFNDSKELFTSIYEEMGNIMWPTYIPDGYAVSSIRILNPRDFAPSSEFFTLSVIFSNGEKDINLSISFFQPYTPFGTSNMGTTFYNERPITIGGMQGALAQIIDGPNLILYDSADATPNQWETARGVSYQFLAHSDDDISEETLIRMAESLVHISDLM